MTARSVPGGEPAIRMIAMPADTNPVGDIFGGWLVAEMDLAAGNVATRHAHGRCATVAVDGIVFHSPVQVGDEVTVFADLIGVGRTSLRLKVVAMMPNAAHVQFRPVLAGPSAMCCGEQSLLLMLQLSGSRDKIVLPEGRRRLEIRVPANC